MTRTLAITLAALAATAVAPSAHPAAGGGTIIVRVTNVRDAKGEVHAEACRQEQFLTDDCPYAGAAPARIGVTEVVLHGVPAGQYAVQAFHDENVNHKVDRNFLGLPREGVGFSNDAPIRLSSPKWAAASFAFNGAEQTIQLRMRYFLGPSGPPATPTGRR